LIDLLTQSLETQLASSDCLRFPIDGHRDRVGVETKEVDQSPQRVIQRSETGRGRRLGVLVLGLADLDADHANLLN
jgi:hypothetical protein